MSEGSSAPSAPAAPVESAPSNSNTSSVESQAQSAQGSEEISDALESGEISPEEVKSMIKKFKLKIKGQEVERDYDLGNEDFLRDQFQLAERAKQEMQSGAELRKAYQREMERLKADPFSVLQELGIDPEELSTGYITKKIEEMKKSPEQLANEKMTKELEEARAEAKKLKEEREAEQMTKMQQEAVVSLNAEIDKAISGHTKLPNTPMVRKKIADSMIWAMNNGFGDVTAEDVVPMVKKEMQEELNNLYEGMDADALEEYIGRKNLDKMRKKRLSTAKPVPGLSDIKPTAAGSRAQQNQQAEPAKKVKARDLFRNLGKQFTEVYMSTEQQAF